LLLQDIADYCLPPYPYEIEKGNLSDDTFISDRTIGIPTNWVWTHPGKYHHNSEDSFDRLTDWDITRRIISVVTAYVYFLASAGKKEILWFEDLALRNMETNVQRECKNLAGALSEERMDYNEAVEKLKFFTDWQKGQIISFGKFCSKKKVERLKTELESIAKKEEKNLSSLKCNDVAKKALSRKEELAQNIVLRRKTICFPCSLSKVPVEKRMEHPAQVEQMLNWVDGKRDLLEILKLFKYETGRTLGEKEISCLIKYVMLLGEYGYLGIHYRTELTKEDIKKDLRKLGIKEGDRIVVHSSLSGLGHVKGGAKTVCRALMELVARDGVLMMPSFNHFTPFKEGGPGYYSPGETPAANGKVPDAFWRMKGVYRSLNPSHAFAVWGKEAESYVRNHHKLLTMGENSPLHLLEKCGGKVVLIDCPTANTFHHVVEMTNNVPCLGKRAEEYPVKMPDGRMVGCRTWGWRNGVCPISDEGAYMKVMKERRLMKKGKTGNAEVLVFEMKNCRKVIENFLKGKVKGFPGCKGCNIQPRVVSATVKNDWDAGNKRVT
jgi:aminoglycoside 3-N-acetyltransferase